MRWYILRTLLHKEALRHIADRGGIVLALLLIGFALMLSLFGKADASAGGPMIGGVKLCYVDFRETGNPWMEHLRQHRSDTNLHVRFRAGNEIRLGPDGTPAYAESVGAIEVQSNGQDPFGRPRFQVKCRHPGQDVSVLAPYLDWFWQESLRYFQLRDWPVELVTNEEHLPYPRGPSWIEVKPADHGGSNRLLYWPPQKGTELAALIKDKGKGGSSPAASAPVEIQLQNEELRDRADARSVVATGLVIFALCFFSFYLLPALTCEERERGVLLAQVLSPASTAEILAAKFLFYPAIGMGLGILLAAIYRPLVLLQPFFWFSLITTAVGYLGVGLTIASLARTQRRASMGAMCYLLTVALLLYITQSFGIPSVQFLMLEFYCPRIMHAALKGETIALHGLELIAAMILAGGWTIWAGYLFRNRGWQ